jgi:TatD DNase family protein
MKIFDSHCHLDDRSFADELDAVVQRAIHAEVRAMMIAGVDEPSSARAIAIAGRYPGIYVGVGVHPHDAKSCDEQTLTRMLAMSTDPKVKAWGEIGLDFNRMHSPCTEQEYWFVRQLECAATAALPAIFHERESQGRFLEILKRHWGPPHKGVVHCFSGTAEELEAYLNMGLYIGITGILTIKSRGQQLRRMVPRIPMERLLVETDAPYLTPTPERNRSRRNEPAFVRTVLYKLAEVLSEDPIKLAGITWNNTCRLFGLGNAVI